MTNNNAATQAADIQAAMGEFYGIIHRNSVALAEEGPWVVDGMSTAAGGSLVKVGELAGGVELWTTHGGTCACCGQSITNIVTFRHAVSGSHYTKNGDRMTLGFDCALTLAHNQKDERMARRIDDAQKAHQRKLAAARKAKKEASVKVDCEPTAARCDALEARSDGFAASFAHSLAQGIRARGKAPSAKQLALLERLEAENP